MLVKTMWTKMNIYIHKEENVTGMAGEVRKREYTKRKEKNESMRIITKLH